jgi:hypothetical protein
VASAAFVAHNEWVRRCGTVGALQREPARAVPVWSIRTRRHLLPSKTAETTMAKRTTHRSSKGTKLYAVRDKQGRFKDIQTYKRAHGADIKRKSKKES